MVNSCKVTHETFPVPLWLSNTLPPFPDLYFPVGQSTANPKSLPASPWRQASVEQMASVCRAAIKEEETSGEMKVGQNWRGGGATGTWSCLCLKPAHKRTHLWHLAVHVRTHVHASPHPPPAPITKHQRGENEKRGRGRQEKCGAQQTAPPEWGAASPSTGEKSGILQLQWQIPQPNQWD